MFLIMLMAHKLDVGWKMRRNSGVSWMKRWSVPRVDGVVIGAVLKGRCAGWRWL